MPMETADQRRQRDNLAFIAEGREFSFGSSAELPRPAAELAALQPDSLGVDRVCTGGLTAVVLRWQEGGRSWAVKQARPRCLVQNPDGQTSFLNELHRHAELAALRRQGVPLPGLVEPVYGSLRQGLIVSPWVDGGRVEAWDRRQLTQVYQSGLALMRSGLFEWDFSPGNVLDDGRQTWLFDFGYMYRFDPLREFNSAGTGPHARQFHLAERIETRNLFGWLLGLEAAHGPEGALPAFRMAKEVALAACAEWLAWLQAAGAQPEVRAEVRATMDRWERALAGDLAALYLAEGWRSHSLDLDDDLRGQTCTPMTLARADWLLAAAAGAHAELQRSGMLLPEEAALGLQGLVACYRGRKAQAQAWQVG